MDEETLFRLMVDLHRDGARQGPGSDRSTLRALELTQLDPGADLRVADIGCGTGASTQVLASALQNAHITAVDLFPEFLEILAERVEAAGHSSQIVTSVGSMDALAFEQESLDLIWSEGAIYNIGFKEGIALWKPLLKPAGVLAVSEITWLRPDPPEALFQHWNGEYPAIATAPEKIALLEQAGYDLIGYFTLPASDWLENYYRPTEARIASFTARHPGQPEAAEIVEMERREAELYARFRDFYSYGFYIARKRGLHDPASG